MLSPAFPVIDPKSDRIVLLGVGNELQGDDAAGLLVIRALAQRLKDCPFVLSLEGGLAPENFTGKIRRFAPTRVIIIDAADLGVEAGTACWVDLQQIDGFSASSHIMPLSVLAKFIMEDIGCQVSIIGIQAQTLEMGKGVSEAVQKAVAKVADDLTWQLSAPA